jgi:hypothetical protein
VIDPSREGERCGFGEGTADCEILAAQIDRDHLRNRGGSHRLLQIVNAAANLTLRAGGIAGTLGSCREQPDAGVSRAGFQSSQIRGGEKPQGQHRLVCAADAPITYKYKRSRRFRSTSGARSLRLRR